MKIELKNIKVNLSLSEETICFSANVYVNGKKSGFASNRGYGGQTDVYLDNTQLRLDVENHFKAIPPRDIDLGLSTGEVLEDFQETIDSYVDELVQIHLKEKEESKIKKSELKMKQSHEAKGFPITLKFIQGGYISYVAVKNDSQIPVVAKKYNVSESIITKVQV